MARRPYLASSLRRSLQITVQQWLALESLEVSPATVFKKHYLLVQESGRVFVQVELRSWMSQWYTLKEDYPDNPPPE